MLEEPCPPSTSPSPEPPKKKGRLRLLILLPAALLVAAALAVAANWTAIRVAVNPLWALQVGAERVMELPQPLSLGFLGEVTAGERAVNCSGVLELQAEQKGLTLALWDCTLGTDENSVTLSAYLSPQVAAASIPLLTGGSEGWYGVSLARPMADQAAGTGGEAEYGWYFSQTQLDQLQSAADQAREALESVTSLTGSPETAQAVMDFLTQARRSGERIPGGYVLSFSENEEENVRTLCRGLGLSEELLTGPVVADFSLTSRGVLRAVSVTSEKLDFTLELGEVPDAELAPRLEAEWTDDKGTECSLTLALTVDRAAALTPPDYENAFTLLPRL